MKEGSYLTENINGLWQKTDCFGYINVYERDSRLAGGYA